MNANTSGIVYALDFDGVLCDSVGESSQTALRAAISVWPHLKVSLPYPTYLLDALRAVRPVVETGFENVVLARLAVEASPDCMDDEFVQPVLQNWHFIRDSVMEEWKVNKEYLIKVFGETRDEWISSEIDSWVKANRM